MKTVALPAESREIQLDERISRLTAVHEVKFLCWLARQMRGNVVEIGCSKGLTTRDLANTNPDKFIYAVDYFGPDRFMPVQQQPEAPSPEEFCIYARDLSNVLCICQNRLNYRALRDVGLIFIDGDHSFEGVKTDSEAALAYLRSQGSGTVIWHDYYEGAPDWVGVKRYIDSLDLDVELDVELVEGTWFAMASVNSTALDH